LLAVTLDSAPLLNSLVDPVEALDDGQWDNDDPDKQDDPVQNYHGRPRFSDVNFPDIQGKANIG
jgi:hypothetical protein